MLKGRDTHWLLLLWMIYSMMFLGEKLIKVDKVV